MFLQLLLSSAKVLDEKIRASVYKTDAGAEVDFIVEKDKKVFAIEIIASKNVGKTDLRELKSFQEFCKKPCELFSLIWVRTIYPLTVSQCCHF